YADFLNRLLAVTETLVRCARDIPRPTAYRPGRRYTEAKAELETARSHLESAVDWLELTGVARRTAAETLVDPAAVTFSTAVDLFERLELLVSDFRTIHQGDALLEEGWSSYLRGLDAYDRDHQFVATDEFAQAESDFLRAERVYEEGQSDAAEEVSALFDARRCQSRRYATAAERMQPAVLLEENSPEKADEYVSEARDLYNNADEACNS
ncbi:MAG: hypothetical protein ABEH47_05270, partial [Haloferacaceae archaeon]